MKCQFYVLSYGDDILVVWRCIQRFFLMFPFIVSNCFLNLRDLCGKERNKSVFLRSNCLKSKIFISKPPNFLEVVVLIFQFKSIFPRNENIYISLALKAKQQKGIQLPYNFVKFSNQFFLFLHFPGLRNLKSFTWRVISMLFLT